MNMPLKKISAHRHVGSGLLAAVLVLSACSSLPPQHRNATQAPATVATTVTAGSWDAVVAQLGQTATRLRANGMEAAPDIMTAVLDLGQIRVSSSNENAQITRVGIPNRMSGRWTEPSGDAEKDRQQRERNRANANGYFEGPIDLRLRFTEWAHAFAVVAPDSHGRVRRSLLFFNAEGREILRLTLANTAHEAAFDQLVMQFRSDDQSAPPLQPAGTAAGAATPAAAPTPDAAIDLAAYHAAWNQITDVHQFNRILRDFKLGREQALRLAPPGKTRELAPESLQALFDGAAARGLPIMVFVSNGAVTQIHGDPVHDVRRVGDWLEVEDPTSLLRVRIARVAHGWQIERGGIYSVDYYDADGQLVTSLFGVRSSAHPVPTEWIDLVKSLPGADDHAGRRLN
ncbi:ChuX/HutX family heme-like substrate-binding protein [Corticibacter populi]|nr:ChuX/HutX family heme-like substrate-binding protein [Corticibacter populi]